jgi:hypothetical protein
MRVRFFKPAYFIWLLILGGGYGTSQIVGLPHLRFVYDFQTTGNPFDPFADRCSATIRVRGARQSR